MEALEQRFVRVAQSLSRDPNIRASAKAVFLAVASYAGNDTALAWPSHARLADDTGTSVSTVKRALRELRDAGYVEWTLRRDRTAVYRVWQPQRGVSGDPTSKAALGPQVAAERAYAQRDTHSPSGHSTTKPATAGQLAVLAKNYEASNEETADLDTMHAWAQLTQAEAHRQIVATKGAYFLALTHEEVEPLDWSEVYAGQPTQ